MLSGSYVGAKEVLGRSYIQKKIVSQGKICSKVIFSLNHLKEFVARWIKIMALAGVLYVNGLFGYIYYLT